MKLINILLLIISITLISCKQRDCKIDVDDWKEKSKIYLKKEVEKLYNKNQKKVASSYSYSLISNREKIIKYLDSVVDIQKEKEIAVFEEFVFHQPSSYFAEVKIDKKIYLFNYREGESSIKESDYTVYTSELFNNEVDHTCNEKKYNDTFQIRKITLYSKFELNNGGFYEFKKICANLNPSGSDI
jgi:hypothetical protein